MLFLCVQEVKFGPNCLFDFTSPHVLAQVGLVVGVYGLATFIHPWFSKYACPHPLVPPSVHFQPVLLSPPKTVSTFSFTCANGYCPPGDDEALVDLFERVKLILRAVGPQGFVVVNADLNVDIWGKSPIHKKRTKLLLPILDDLGLVMVSPHLEGTHTRLPGNRPGQRALLDYVLARALHKWMFAEAFLLDTAPAGTTRPSIPSDHLTVGVKFTPTLHPPPVIVTHRWNVRLLTKPSAHGFNTQLLEFAARWFQLDAAVTSCRRPVPPVEATRLLWKALVLVFNSAGKYSVGKNAVRSGGAEPPGDKLVARPSVLVAGSLADSTREELWKHARAALTKVKRDRRSELTLETAVPSIRLRASLPPPPPVEPSAKLVVRRC